MMEDLKSEMGQFKDQISIAEGKAIQAEQQVRQAGEILAAERQQATEHAAEARQLARLAEEALAKERSLLVTRINQLEERIAAEVHPEPVFSFSETSYPLPSLQPTHGGAASPSGVPDSAMDLDSEEGGHTATSQGQAACPTPANPLEEIVPSCNTPIASGSRTTQTVRNVYYVRVFADCPTSRHLQFQSR
jgi:hypothetical protein